jgi:hypothetical protein
METKKDDVGRVILNACEELTNDEFIATIKKLSQVRSSIDDVDFNILNSCMEHSINKTFHPSDSPQGIEAQFKEQARTRGIVFQQRKKKTRK